MLHSCSAGGRLHEPPGDCPLGLVRVRVRVRARVRVRVRLRVRVRITVGDCALGLAAGLEAGLAAGSHVVGSPNWWSSSVPATPPVR